MVKIGIIVGAAVAVTAVAAILRRKREGCRCRVHAYDLRLLSDQALGGDWTALESRAHRCHEAGPGPAAAEAWFALGCSLLDTGKPQQATRPFQLACHAQAGMNAAVLLAFTCLKTRNEDMPDFPRILAETYAEIRKPPIPAGRWERIFLDAYLHTIPESSPLQQFLRTIRTH